MSRLAIHAQDFLNAYEVLRESNNLVVQQKEDHQESRNRAYGNYPTMGVEIVCLSFSVELHLKELHRVVSGESPRGHNIFKLFKKLPLQCQAEIISHESITRYEWSNEQFEKELENISNGFEEWRYAYESTSLRYDTYVAKVLIEAIKHVVKKRGSA